MWGSGAWDQSIDITRGKTHECRPPNVCQWLSGGGTGSYTVGDAVRSDRLKCKGNSLEENGSDYCGIINVLHQHRSFDLEGLQLLADVPNAHSFFYGMRREAAL